MSPLFSSSKPALGFDFMPLLLAIVAAFVILGSLQFAINLPGAERGLVAFEKACPIHAAR